MKRGQPLIQFFSLADASLGTKTEGLALCKALAFCIAKGNPDLQSQLVARLRARMKNHEEVRRMAWDDTRIPLLAELGTPKFSAEDTEGHTLIFIDREGKVAGEGVAHSAEHWIREELGLPPPDCHGSTSIGANASADAEAESD